MDQTNVIKERFKMKPFPIKYGNMKKTRYCCPVCLKTLKKTDKFCVNCFIKNGEMRMIEWEELKDVKD